MVKGWTRFYGHKDDTFYGHKDKIWHVAFGPTDETLVSASEDNTIKQWDRKGRVLQTLGGHNARVWHVAFDREGQDPGQRQLRITPLSSGIWPGRTRAQLTRITADPGNSPGCSRRCPQPRQ